MKKLILKMALCLILITGVQYQSFAGWFDFLYELDVNVGLDKETQAQLRRMMQRAQSLEASMNGLPANMRREMEPLIEKAAREMENVINTMGITMLNVADKTLTDLERITNSTLDRAENIFGKTMNRAEYIANHGLDKFNTVSQQLITQANNEINNSLRTFETISLKVINEAKAAVAISLNQAEDAARGVVGELNIGVERNIDKFGNTLDKTLEQAIKNAATRTEKLMYVALTELQGMQLDLHVLVNQQRVLMKNDIDTTLANAKTYAHNIVKHIDEVTQKHRYRFTRDMEKIVKEFDGVFQEGLDTTEQKLIAVTDNAYKKAQLLNIELNNTLSTNISHAEQAVDRSQSALFFRISKLALLIVLLLLGYGIASRAISEQIIFSQSQITALLSVSIVCLVFIFWNKPLYKTFDLSKINTEHIVNSEPIHKINFPKDTITQKAIKVLPTSL